MSQTCSGTSRAATRCNILVCNLTPDISGGDVIDWIQQKPLVGQKWDGFQNIRQDLCNHVSNTLSSVIQQTTVLIDDCPEIDFNSTLSLFEGEPRPFHISLRPSATLSYRGVPTEISHYLQICSRQFCLPNDFASTVFLALSAGIIGRSTCLEMRPGQDWMETTNIWAVLVGNPSTKKSPTYRRIARLIVALQQTALRSTNKP